MKIKRIEIDGFRGISNQLCIDFSKKGRPISTIIFGDNGTGKSSIIDAIEFNLQGKLERSDSLNNEFRPSVTNFRNNILEGSKTILHFEDDSSNSRDILVDFDIEKDKHIYSRSTNPLNKYFNIAPIALRRNDIITYSLTPSEKKQVIFWTFIYRTKFPIDKTEEENDLVDNNLISELSSERLELKNKRKELREKLSDILKIPVEEIPIMGTVFDQFIKEKIRNGVSKQQYRSLKEMGHLKGVNEVAITVSDKLLIINQEIITLNNQLGRMKKLNSPSSERRKEETRRFLEEASLELTTSFLEITNSDFVKEISVKMGEQTDVSFELEVTLKNGVKTFPNKIFSEANLDLLILLLYTSIIKESNKYGQSKLIILDDVLQSVDSVIRINFMEYLLNSFKDWQFIITTHDRLWLNQLRSSFRRNSHRFKELEIFRWDFQNGLQIYEQSHNFQNSSLVKAIETKDTQIIASQTGLFLEFMSNIHSMNLNLSIQRKKDDKYNLGDLWPGLVKYFKKTSLCNHVVKIDKLLHIRNLLGAHYNDWAISLSNSDIREFSTLVNDFYLLTFCQNCESWVNKENTCNCRKIDINNAFNT
ncbi:AAA family ATPase [Chryseobacterium sp. 3008163]|uniref:AAA family ATPase n=1 Tax=Chryseobacterium sp. 3008163 TaxID=2478663 RepID=UPI000F0C72F0|nr:AAA family ATPase [Chryseobacterium sp. 3008163]AYM99181.1 DUF2813 domain-containing protein [Chryseobacterium sp. 3008163]